MDRARLQSHHDRWIQWLVSCRLWCLVSGIEWISKYFVVICVERRRVQSWRLSYVTSTWFLVECLLLSRDPILLILNCCPNETDFARHESSISSQHPPAASQSLRNLPAGALIVSSHVNWACSGQFLLFLTSSDVSSGLWPGWVHPRSASRASPNQGNQIENTARDDRDWMRSLGMFTYKIWMVIANYKLV